jgi:hypothetical protein
MIELRCGDAFSELSSIDSETVDRMLKIMAIADDRHFSYDNETELIQFITSEMEKEGLDLNNEENLDSYLNTKFM